ncbi:MAG TPA: kelch repeat-containing protein [Gemmatimonadaceae bacterium]|nr:kelch repeat-containing protein [Gemmatimonadaceae bacterium]
MSFRPFLTGSALLLVVSGCSSDEIVAPSPAQLSPARHTGHAVATWQTLAPRTSPSAYGFAHAFNGMVLSIGGYHGHLGNEQPAFLGYMPGSDSWGGFPNSPAPRTSWAVAVANGKMYLFGGWDGGSESNFIEVYDLDTQVWTLICCVPRNHLLGAAGEIGGRIYLAGGGGNYSGLKAETDIFDPLTNTWTVGANIPTMRGAVAGAALGGKLYVAGGLLNDGTRVAALEAYDPVTNSWSTRAPMPTARAAATALAVNGKLWVVGGSTNNPDYAASLTNVVEIYDPATDTWTTGIPMPTPRQAPQLALLGSTVHAIAGHGPTSGLTVHEALVVASDPPPASSPTTKPQCAGGGWAAFGFRNQGQCVRYVETGKDSR